MFGGYHDMLGFGGLWMIFIWLIIIGVIIYVVKIAVDQNKAHREHPPSPTESPLDILKRRYAAGEITKEEFEQKKHDILSG
jgi:putative membrane protein